MGNGVSKWQSFCQRNALETNSEKYEDVLSSFAVPLIKSKHGKDYIFQQDNCSVQGLNVYLNMSTRVGHKNFF